MRQRDKTKIICIERYHMEIEEIETDISPKRKIIEKMHHLRVIIYVHILNSAAGIY